MLLNKALQVMHVVPKACDDMMHVGRLQGFDGKITAQGKLLKQVLYSAFSSLTFPSSFHNSIQFTSLFKSSEQFQKILHFLQRNQSTILGNFFRGKLQRVRSET